MASSSHDHYADDAMREILRSTRTIAVVGASNNPARPSYGVMQYMLSHGYDVVPVNPGLAGGEILGLPVFARLADVTRPIDMVDIFRNSEAAGGVTDEALALDALPAVIWMQLGVRDDAAAERAEAKGVTVVMDRCPKIEHARFASELSRPT